MQQTQTIVGLDVGSNKIAAVVGTIAEGLTQVVGVAEVPSQGVRKGVVNDIEECVSAISSALEQAERMAGIPVEHAVVGVGGTQIGVTNSKGVIAVSRGDGEISALDVERVIDAARAVALPPNREILHVIPKNFVVDGQEAVKDPVGMTGVRLETEAIVVGASTASLRNLTRCVTQAGLAIDNLIFSPLATAEALITRKQKEAGVLMLDIGGATTGLAVYEEGNLLHATIIPVGSSHITNDIAIGLRTTLDVAEAIKKEHGIARSDEAKNTTIIDLSKYDPEETQKVKQSDIAEIIEARLKELFEKVQSELKAIGKDGMLPAGVVLTGGGSQLKDIAGIVKDELHLPAVSNAKMVELSGAVDKIDSPVYATSVGLMLSGLTQPTVSRANNKFSLQIPGSFQSVTNKAKDLFKQFLP